MNQSGSSSRAYRAVVGSRTGEQIEAQMTEMQYLGSIGELGAGEVPRGCTQPLQLAHEHVWQGCSIEMGN
jgi:hypothetical protein